MTAVVDLAAERSKRSTHIEGKALCIGCKHEWQAVAPAGTTWLECPECHAEKGIFRFRNMRIDEPHWTCSCGNDLFHVTPKGTYCPNCGCWQYVS